MSYEELDKELSKIISYSTFLESHTTDSNINERERIKETLLGIICKIHISELPHSIKQKLFNLMEPSYDMISKKLRNDLWYLRLK